MNKRISTILALSLAIIGGVFFATAATAAGFTPVTLLHWNNGLNRGQGGYEEITVDTEGALNGHCRSHPLDIIPLGACDFLTPTVAPTDAPTAVPTEEPTSIPTEVPDEPTAAPTTEPTAAPTDEPTQEPTASPTDLPGPIPTDAVDPTPTDVGDPEPTVVPDPTPVIPPVCDEVKDEPCGFLFHLVGPEGQEADFASFSPRPDGGWYLPNIGAQLNCLGWVAVAAPYGRPLYGNEVLTSCEGGRCYQEGQ